MEAPAASDAKAACLERTSAALTVDDVYEIAKLIGAEVERLIDGFGKESAVALVPKIVKVLELLESFASRNHALKVREEELLKTFESLQLQQQQQQHKKRATKDGDESTDGASASANGGDRTRELQQKEEQWRRKCEELQVQVQQLQEESQQLHSQLRGNHQHEDRVQRQEREVMLKLKEVVDKQRDELRAKVQEISSISKEVEALQEQLDRFMKMNAELRHKQSVLQAQLRSSVERKADMEADLKEKSQLIDNLHRQLHASHNSASQQSPLQPAAEPGAAEPGAAERQNAERQNAEQPCFTKKEVRDIIFERNELKTNLFLVQEELNYYQREILNEERCPGFLLEAVRSAITKRRRLIKAKMLGIIVNDCSSSDEEDKAPLTDGHTATQTDETDKHAESRIRNLFGFLTRSGSGRSPTHSGSAHPSPAHMPNSVSSWEILGDGEEDGETERPASP